MPVPGPAQSNPVCHWGIHAAIAEAHAPVAAVARCTSFADKPTALTGRSRDQSMGFPGPSVQRASETACCNPAAMVAATADSGRRMDKMAGPRLKASSLPVAAAAPGKGTPAAAVEAVVVSWTGMGRHDRLKLKLTVVAAGVEHYFLKAGPLRDYSDL